MLKKMEIILKPYSSLLFLNNKYIGLLLLLVTFINPSVAISGLFALISTIIFAEFIGLREEYLENGFYLYNSLLVGMGIGFLFSPTPISLFFILILAIFTFLVSFVLNRIFAVYKIPILSLPFSLITIVAYLASLKYSHLFSNLINNHLIFDISIASYIDPFFRALGTIFFLSNVLVGMVIFLIILFFSRIMALMALVGFSIGIFIHSLFVTNFYEALNDPYSFNYILVAISLGGVFLLPTLKNYILALIGVVLSVVLVDAMSVFFNYYSLPVFTLPFNIVVMMFVFTLGMIAYKEFNYNIRPTPERSLSYYLSNVFRFSNSIKISLPFSNEWSVYQAFNGEWTHKGKWKYAYDFVIKKDSKTYQNEGLYLSDYYCFGESVLSPINGYVVALRGDLVDNIIGEVDRVNNWGNYIIIKSDYGYFVEISHLMQNSINVKVGDYVYQGQVIAKCGNSGYSPEPHIHIQVQKYAVLGSETLPFVFSEYFVGGKLKFNALPKKDEIVKSVLINKAMQMRFNFILDEEYKYEVFKDGKKIDEVSFKVEMNNAGEFYFREGKNKLYFANFGFFYFYSYVGGESYLKELFKLAPRIPFVIKAQYVDYLPIYLLENRFKSMLIELLSSFNQLLYKREFSYNLDNLYLSSKFGKVKFGYKGFEEIEFNNIILKGIK